MPLLELNHAAGRCPILIRRGLLDDPAPWSEYIHGKVLVVTDRNVAPLYLQRLSNTLGAAAPESLVLEAGEPAKHAGNWQKILETLAAIGAQRDATVIALGGGVIGDLAGFAAASYMRGIDVVQVPTTLLAQVDAAIGGKTGFNLAAGKNLVGAFHQPRAVMIDVDALTTLARREYVAGLAEVVKYGAIGEAGFLEWLRAHVPALLDRRAETVEQAVHRAVAQKIAVVEADEHEAGGRALLNFGHTFAHAIETATGYERYLHGEAVAIGMHLAARLSARLGRLATSDAETLTGLIEAFGLPTRPPADIEPARLVDHMRLDKKNRAGRIRLILLDALGRAVIDDNVAAERIEEILKT